MIKSLLTKGHKDRKRSRCALKMAASQDYIIKNLCADALRLIQMRHMGLMGLDL